TGKLLLGRIGSGLRLRRQGKSGERDNHQEQNGEVLFSRLGHNHVAGGPFGIRNRANHILTVSIGFSGARQIMAVILHGLSLPATRVAVTLGEYGAVPKWCVLFSPVIISVQCTSEVA